MEASGEARVSGPSEAAPRAARPSGGKRALRLAALALTALLPGFLKRAVLRHVFGYQVGRNVKLGLSLIDARRCRIDDGVHIGHGNLFLGLGELQLGERAIVRHFNIVRGGDSVSLGRYSEVLRFNVINAIPENDCLGDPEPRFVLGDASVITAGHRLDFTDSIHIGRHSMIGGRASSLWTHSRQRTKPIRIGDHVLVASECRLGPGVEVHSFCIIGLGSVVIGRVTEPHSFVSGFPARAVRTLTEEDEVLVTYRTRADLPPDLRYDPARGRRSPDLASETRGR
jgi:acetyltransferase-like isoleucine patch superfamily enzyme